MSILWTVFLVLIVVFFAAEMIRHVRRLNMVRRLIDTYEHDVENPALMDEIYGYCTSDWKLRRIVKKYGATREDFVKIMKKLLVRCNFRRYNRFVPISAFFNTGSLRYVLKHKDADEFQLAKHMLDFFNI